MSQENTNQGLAQLLRGGRPALGFWAGLGSAEAIEALGVLGADWILIDCEHGAASLDSITPLLRALAASPTTAIVRPPSADPVAVSRLADAGAGGVLLPRIKTAAEVQRAVAAAHYPPRGTRGIGPWRASGYFTDFKNYVESTHQDFVVAAQIETNEAVAALVEIGAIDGIDALFIGPADLSAAMGHFPDTNHPEVEAVYARVRAACQQNGVAAGFYCTSGKAAAQRLAEGFTMVSVCSDIAAITSAAGRQLNAARTPSE